MKANGLPDSSGMREAKRTFAVGCVALVVLTLASTSCSIGKQAGWDAFRRHDYAAARTAWKPIASRVLVRRWLELCCLPSAIFFF